MLVVVALYDALDAVDRDTNKDEGKGEEQDERDFPEMCQLKGMVNSIDAAAHRCMAMVDIMTMGIGNPTISRSVITSLTPMVMS